MNKRTAKAPARTISALEAAAMVKSGMWLDLGGVNSQSETFDRALAARRDELTDVKILRPSRGTLQALRSRAAGAGRGALGQHRR